MKKTFYFVSLLNALLLVFIIYRFGIPILNSTESLMSNTDSIGVWFSAQANQFALIQLLLSIFGIGVAFVTIWGYMTIKESAANAAEKAVKEGVPKFFKEMFDKIGREELQRMLVEIKLESTQQKNSSHVFEEGIERLSKDPMDVPDDE